MYMYVFMYVYKYDVCTEGTSIKIHAALASSSRKLCHLDFQSHNFERSYFNH